MKRDRGEVFARYLISYAGIAVIACMIVSVVFFTLSVIELKTIFDDEAQAKLELACEDMVTQLDVMKKITLRIKTTACYRPEYIKASSLNQRAMIDDLKRFADYLPYPYEYYLYYRNMGYLYSSTAKYSEEIFSKYILGISDQTVFEALFQNEQNPNVQMQKSRPDSLMIQFPISLFGEEACMLFIIKNSDLLNRIGDVSGLRQDRLSIFYDGSQISGGNIGDKILKQDTTLKALSFAVSVDSIYLRTEGLLCLTVVTLVMVFVLIVVLSQYRAIENYKPIQRILRTYIPESVDSRNDEFEIIEGILDTAVHSSFISQRRIQDMVLLINEQRERLRQAMLCHILEGNALSLEEAELDGVGIQLVGRMFSLWKLFFSDGRKLQPAAAEIENWSHDNVVFMAVSMGSENSLYVVVNYEEDMDSVDMKRFFESAVERVAPERVISGGNCLSLDGLKDLKSNTDNEELVHINSLLDEVYYAVEELNAEKAIRAISEIVGGVYMSSAPLHVRKGVCSEILGKLLAFIQPDKLRANAVEVMRSVDAGDLQLFMEKIEGYVNELITLKKSWEETAVTDEILAYIEDNLNDYNLSLKCLAEKFGFSTRFISELIKNRTGLSYIDYVRGQRMRCAERLLSETQMSVTEIGENLGYVSISYFIRTFKDYSGITPANYRKAYGKKVRLNEIGEVTEK